MLKNNRGITMIALVITVIVLLILASITTYSGVSTVREARFYNAVSEMKVMQAKVNEIYDEYKYTKNKPEFINKYGENIQDSLIEIDAQNAFDSLGIASEMRSQYRYYNADYIKNELDLDGISYDFLVNIKMRDVILLQGIQKDGQTYYSLSQIPNEQYNIPYDKSDMLTASIELKETRDKKVNVVLYIPNNYEYYSYKTFINGEEFQSGTTNSSVVTMNEYETEFDAEITAYVEIQYEEKTIKTNEVTKNDYKIKTAAELKKLSENVNNGKSYEGITITQIGDIDLEGNSTNQWTPIGTENNQFGGIYEGNDHKISNIYIDTTLAFQGLFGYNKGTIKNLKVDGNITSTDTIIGGIAGENFGEILNCISDVIVTGGKVVGGIAGDNNRNIMNCINSNKIEGTAVDAIDGYIGGIAGWNRGRIEKSQNDGNVISKSNCTGGISGSNFQTINSCFNTGKISSSGYSGTGGIIGYQRRQFIKLLL